MFSARIMSPIAKGGLPLIRLPVLMLVRLFLEVFSFIIMFFIRKNCRVRLAPDGAAFFCPRNGIGKLF
jgi:hypothetical protein